MIKLLYALIAVAIAIQFIRPDFKNPKVDETVTLQADKKVMDVLKPSCYDCHSNETKYPWYSHISPVSWMMEDHINDGRKALNFSEWANIDPKVKADRLKRAIQLIDHGTMPKTSYLLMHKEADLSKDQKETLKQFFEAEMKKLPNQPAYIYNDFR